MGKTPLRAWMSLRRGLFEPVSRLCLIDITDHSELRRRGLDAVLVMGGMVDWLERGYRVERTSAVST